MKRSGQSRLRRAEVVVPATTANVGCGFDALGIALSLANTCRIQRGGDRPVWDGVDADARAMLSEAAERFFERARVPAHGFTFKISGPVPIARGLGSSVTVRLGALAGLNALAGSPLGRDDLLALASELEGHPDNAAPAVHGGATAAVQDHSAGGTRVSCVKVSLDPKLRFLLAVPDHPVRTEDARRALPQSYSRSEAVHNLGRACLFISALAQRKYKDLWVGVDDRWHQPFRAPLVPELPRVLEAARTQGALAGWLSGSGSSVCVLTLGAPSARLKAAIQAAVEPAGSVLIASPDNRGFIAKAR